MEIKEEYNQTLYKRAYDAIERYFSDSNVPKEVTIKNLERLKEEIEIMLEGLNNS